MNEAEFSRMLAADERHWWYQGRRRVLEAVLDTITLPAGARILDAGCGSGRTLDLLAQRGSVAGADLNPLGVAHAKKRGHADTHVAAVESLPFRDEEFDLVTCLDVIEHTPDDEVTLRELRRVTKPGGSLVVTVPAYPALWSAHDVANQHYRRYVRTALRQAASAADWQIKRETSFNSLLLAPAAIIRLAERLRRDQRGTPDLELTPPRINGLLELPMRLEASLIRRGINLFAGLSLLAVMENNAPIAATATEPNQSQAAL